MQQEVFKPVVITCGRCGFDNVFDQPYRYHAGFGDQGFLYNERGNRTLIWSCWDPGYCQLVGERNPWTLGPENRRKVEDALETDPAGGGRWLFQNVARCLKCGHEIADSMTGTIYYLEYDGSLNLDCTANRDRGLRDIIKNPE